MTPSQPISFLVPEVQPLLSTYMYTKVKQLLITSFYLANIGVIFAIKFDVLINLNLETSFMIAEKRRSLLKK